MIEKERIKEIRKDAHLSQTAFGEKIGLSLGEIRNLESGITVLKELTVPILLREFNVNESWLRTGEGEMHVPLSRDEELARAFGSVLKGDNEFRKRFIQMILQLDDQELDRLREFAEALVKEKDLGFPQSSKADMKL